jgi:hypothetical protein
LDGYYGDILMELVQKRVDKPLKLFIHIMLYKRALVLKDVLEAERIYKRIVLFKIEEDIHEILMGRYLAVKFLNVGKGNDYQVLIETVRSFIQKRDSRHVIAFLFYLCKDLILQERVKAFQDVMKIVDFYLTNQKMTELFHWEKRVLNGIDLLKCLYLLGIKRGKRVKSCI